MHTFGTNQRKSMLDSPITFQVTGSNARLPICLVSGNPAERLGDEWVQTRGYQACVVYMPIPLRVCLAGAPTNYKAFSGLRKQLNCPHTIIDNKYIKCL